MLPHAWMGKQAVFEIVNFLESVDLSKVQCRHCGTLKRIHIKNDDINTFFHSQTFLKKQYILESPVTCCTTKTAGNSASFAIT